MPVVFIPSPMRDLSQGVAQVEVTAKTLGEVIQRLEELYPGMRDRLCQGDKLRDSIQAAVDGAMMQRRLQTPVSEKGEVHFLPAIGGG
ncbi:MAG: MoaD/ThiS family protein [Pirellulales bacterium]